MTVLPAVRNPFSAISSMSNEPAPATMMAIFDLPLACHGPNVAIRRLVPFRNDDIHHACHHHIKRSCVVATVLSRTAGETVKVSVPSAIALYYLDCHLAIGRSSVGKFHNSLREEEARMANIKVHYDGWVVLPEDFRHKLGIGTNDSLTAEIVGDTIVLRSRRSVEAAASPDMPAPVANTAANVAAKPKVKRAAAAAKAPATAAGISALPRARGRPRIRI